MESVIADAQTLLNELQQNEKARERVEILLNAAQFIRDEMRSYLLADGSLNIAIAASGRYAAAPFAMIETNIYIIKKLSESGNTLSASHLERLESMDAKVKSVRERLDEIWRTE